MDPQEELRGFVDNDQFVSYRWLAFCLNIHVEKSKSILEKFKNSNNDISATYCVSGQLKNKQQSISVVTEKNLARCKDLFEVINCTHIYSIQKNKFAESTNVPLQLNAADVQQANELIAQQPHNIPLLLNSVGGIKLEGSDVQAIGKRVAAIVRTIPTSETDSNTANAERGMSKAFYTASDSSKDKNGASSSSGKDGSKDKSKEKSKSMASAFFANSTSSTPATEKPKPVKKTPMNAKKPPPAVKAATTVTKDKVESKQDEGEGAGEDEDDEWTEEGGESYKPDKKKLKNRKSVTIDQKSSDGEAVSTSQPSLTENEEQDDKDEEKVETKKAQIHVHGAMDDYMEDVAVEKFKAGQSGESNDAEPVMSGKRTKRKLVEKMFGDAKGYLITEMVWEDVTDDDEPAPARSGAVAVAGSEGSRTGPVKEKRPAADTAEEDEGDKEGSDKKKGSAKTAAPAKKAKKAAPVVQQKGMMSFFGKK